MCANDINDNVFNSLGGKTNDSLRMKIELHVNFKAENNILLKIISTMYANMQCIFPSHYKVKLLSKYTLLIHF